MMLKMRRDLGLPVRTLARARARAPSVSRRVQAPKATIAPDAPAALPQRVSSTIAKFQAVPDSKDRYKLMLQYAAALAPFPEQHKTPVNRVMGCTAQVWIHAELDAAGKVQLAGTSDSDLTRGMCAVLVECLSGLSPEQVLQVDEHLLSALHLSPALMGPSRANGLANMLDSIKRRTRALVKDLPRFPSLRITASELQPQGAFAEAQAQFLQPDQQQVEALVSLFKQKQIGVVAHFYMDPQVQGVLSAASEHWPHVFISDSLVMADTAVKMAQAGCKYICVLGVDFMSENVRAILDNAGFADVQVYRMDAADIGCSLAEAAESQEYERYLQEAARTPSSLHVVYINTSLRTKAGAHALVPTITCTSSNVVQTVLQAFAQVPGATVWYGPDTYMGRNLAQLFTMLASLPDAEVRKLHPGHTQASIRALLPRLKYYENGTCIVHHIFGGEVCEIVREAYSDAYLTAHFEVPGEMFSLAMAARRKGMGTVGSTSNILDFIAAKVNDALAQPHSETLQFVLGTEAGMITAIVRKVQALLSKAGRDDVAVEIVFPVMPSAISTPQQQTSGAAPLTLPAGLALVPGPAGGEGCSLEGGCASCPFMKMNTLAALQGVCEKAGSPAGEALLESFKPRAYSELVGGKTIAQAGCEPILHMRHFQTSKTLSDELVADITGRHEAAGR